MFRVFEAERQRILSHSPGLLDGISPSFTMGGEKIEDGLLEKLHIIHHGSLNVPIEHHPTIRYMVYNGYYKVMSNIPKMGHLPTPVHDSVKGHILLN